jgi:elongation factor 1-beta
MAVSFANVNSDAGLKKLDEYLLSRSYITGYVTQTTLCNSGYICSIFTLYLSSLSYQASKDDLAVYSSFSAAPSSKYINVARWFSHIDALVRLRYPLLLAPLCFSWHAL